MRLPFTLIATQIILINSIGYAKNDSITLMESCGDHSASKLGATSSNEIRIMSYNVENLFDAEHDKGKVDFQYMPRVVTDEDNRYISGPKVKYKFCIDENRKSLETCPDIGELAEICRKNADTKMKYCLEDDWTEKDSDKKLSQMKKSFDIQFKKGVLPEILVLTEVENPKITTALAKKIGMLSTSCTTLGKCRNKSHMGLVMTNGPDQRGVEVAVVYNSKKLEFIDSKTYSAKAGGIRATRDILEAHFIVDGKYDLFIYGNHWPSQGGPTWLRNNVAYQLKNIIRKTMDKYPGAFVVATGDFNTTSDEKGYNRHPFDDILLKGSPRLLDLDQHSIISTNPSAKRGSYYYPNEVSWSHFDKFFVSKNLTEEYGLKVDLNSHQLHNHKRLTEDKSINIYRDQEALDSENQRTGDSIRYYGLLKSVESQKVKNIFSNSGLESLEVIESCAPKRFQDYNDKSNRSGYSDHFPISVVLSF